MGFLDKIKICIVRSILGFRFVVIDVVRAFLFTHHASPKKILVHRIGTFGDSVVALPAVASLRHTFPDAKIDFVTTYATPINLSSIIAEGFFDEVYLIDKKNRRAELKKLKRNGYDLFVDIPQKYGLYKSLRNMFLARFYLGIPCAFGWDAGMTKLFAKAQMEYDPPKNEVSRFLDTMEQNGIAPKLEFPIRTQAYDIELDKDKTIAFCIGTNVQANEWETEKWLEVASRLTSDGLTIVIIGGEQERAKGEQISQNINGITNLCGKLTIAQSAYVLSKCCLAVCHDTGAMHLAYAVGTKVVALMSSRQPYSKWSPPQNLGVVIQKTLECSGCFKSICGDNRCMRQISSDDVLNVIKREDWL